MFKFGICFAVALTFAAVPATAGQRRAVFPAGERMHSSSWEHERGCGPNQLVGVSCSIFSGRFVRVSAQPSKGVAYCGEAAGKQRIEYHTPEQPDGEWDAVVTVNGTDIRAVTAYSYFGKTQPPRGFVVALLGEDHSEYLVFEDAGRRWLEFGDSRYDECD